MVFIARVAISPANDQVNSYNFTISLCLLIRQSQAKFSADKRSLIEDAIRENCQTFTVTDMPTLGDLRWTVVAITQVLRRYELFRVCLP